MRSLCLANAEYVRPRDFHGHSGRQRGSQRAEAAWAAGEGPRRGEMIPTPLDRKEDCFGSTPGVSSVFPSDASLLKMLQWPDQANLPIKEWVRGLGSIRKSGKTTSLCSSSHCTFPPWTPVVRQGLWNELSVKSSSSRCTTDVTGFSPGGTEASRVRRCISGRARETGISPLPFANVDRTLGA